MEEEGVHAWDKLTERQKEVQEWMKGKAKRWKEEGLYVKIMRHEVETGDTRWG